MAMPEPANTIPRRRRLPSDAVAKAPMSAPTPAAVMTNERSRASPCNASWTKAGKSSLFAALTGLWDAWKSSDAGTQARRTINTHATIMLSVTASVRNWPTIRCRLAPNLLHLVARPLAIAVPFALAGAALVVSALLFGLAWFGPPMRFGRRG